MPFRISRDKSSAFCDFQTLSFCFHANRVDNLPVSVRLVSLKQSGDCKNFRLYQLPNRNKFYTKKKNASSKKNTLNCYWSCRVLRFSDFSTTEKKLRTSLNAQAIAQTSAIPVHAMGRPQVVWCFAGILFSGFPHIYSLCLYIYITLYAYTHVCCNTYIYMWWLYVIIVRYLILVVLV